MTNSFSKAEIECELETLSFKLKTLNPKDSESIEIYKRTCEEMGALTRKLWDIKAGTKIKLRTEKVINLNHWKKLN